MKAVDCALLHRWRSELEEFWFIVKHQPRKSQKHVDVLSHTPIDTPEDEEELGIRAITQLPAHVQQELRDINDQTQRGDES